MASSIACCRRTRFRSAPVEGLLMRRLLVIALVALVGLFAAGCAAPVAPPPTLTATPAPTLVATSTLTPRAASTPLPTGP